MSGRWEEVPSTGLALSTLAVNMMRAGRDWEEKSIDSILYHVIHGFSSERLARVAERHGWSADDIDVIEKIRDGLRPDKRPVFVSGALDGVEIDVGEAVDR